MGKLVVSAEKCTGCRICEVVCSARIAGKFNPSRSAIFVESLLPESNTISPFFCVQCEEPICVKACPVEALVKDEKLGIYIVDEDICNGCGACVEVCPYKGIRLDPVEKFAIKCDLCEGKPRCVEMCPVKILEMIE